MDTTFAADALAEVRRIREAREAYDADVKAWYEHGDGRSTREGGRGYAYPYCIHGVSLRVDYDCACWQCEAGEPEGGDYAAGLTYARRKARERAAKRQATLDALDTLDALSTSLRTMGASEDDVMSLVMTVARAIGKASKE